MTFSQMTLYTWRKNMADINRALTEPVAAVDGSTTVCFLDNAEGLALSVKALQVF